MRRHLKLTRRDFIVPRRDGHAELVQLELDLGYAGLHPLGDSAEVVILELLPARRRRAYQCSSAHHKIRTHREVRAIDKEVLLLGPKRRENPEHALVAEQLQQLDRLFGKNVGAAEQRRHLVERLPVVTDEHRRNAKRACSSRFDNEHGTRRIPRGITTGFPGGAKSTRGKARRIRLALNEL